MKQKTSILIKLYRIYHWFYIHKMKFLANVSYRITLLLFGCSIPPSCILEEGVDFGHPIGIVIHQNAKIGQNTVIYQNVTIGRKNRDNQECPEVGKNCLIGAGACLLGNIRIGDNVKIGANAVIITDIPAGSTVFGNPAQIIKSKITKDL